MQFTIPGEIPDMNTIVKKSKTHYIAYSYMKKDYTTLVQMRAGNLPKVEKADFEITWYCKDRRKDKDNIMAGQKFIYDGLVKAGVLANDGWAQIGNITNKFEVSKENTRVEVKIHVL